MHKDLRVTDGVYSILSESDVKAEIAELGSMNNSNSKMTTDQLISVIKQLLERLEKGSSKLSN